MIISAGTISDYGYIKGLIKDTDFIVCADGGLDHCLNMGLKPDLIVGDFDSYGRKPQGFDAPVITYPVEKDFTDTNTALLEAAERGCDDFLLVGVSGTRLDHTLSNIGLLETARRMGFRAIFADSHNIMFSAQKHQLVHGRPGTNISLIPIEPVKGITLKGFKYPLENAEIDLYKTIWVSNVLACETGEITFEQGVLIVDISRD